MSAQVCEAKAISPAFARICLSGLSGTRYHTPGQQLSSVAKLDHGVHDFFFFETRLSGQMDALRFARETRQAPCICQNLQRVLWLMLSGHGKEGHLFLFVELKGHGQRAASILRGFPFSPKPKTNKLRCGALFSARTPL